MHRPTGVLRDELRRIVGQVVHAEGPRQGGRPTVPAVVIAQHGEALLQALGEFVPHRQVATQRMAQHNFGAAALADKVNGWHQGVTEEKSGKASVNEDDHSAPGALTPMKYL